MARELRLSAARQEREAKSRVMNLSSPVLENGRRGSSFSPGPNHNYHQYSDFQRSESVLHNIIKKNLEGRLDEDDPYVQTVKRIFDQTN